MKMTIVGTKVDANTIHIPITIVPGEAENASEAVIVLIIRPSVKRHLKSVKRTDNPEKSVSRKKMIATGIKMDEESLKSF